MMDLVSHFLRIKNCLNTIRYQLIFRNSAAQIKLYTDFDVFSDKYESAHNEIKHQRVGEIQQTINRMILIPAI